MQVLLILCGILLTQPQSQYLVYTYGEMHLGVIVCYSNYSKALG